MSLGAFRLRWAKAAATATPLFLALGLVVGLWGCFSGNKTKGIGDDAKSETHQGGSINSGGGTVYAFNLSRTEQGLGGGLALSAGMLGVSYFRSRRTDKALRTVVGAIEEGDCKDCKRCVSSHRDHWLNRKVAKLTKPRTRSNRVFGDNGPEPKSKRPNVT